MYMIDYMQNYGNVMKNACKFWIQAPDGKHDSR